MAVYWVGHVATIDIASYTDGNIPISVGKKQCDLETKLKKTSVKIFKQFYEKGVKANWDRGHFLSSLDISTKILLPAVILGNPSFQKIIGVTNDRELKLLYNLHVTWIMI